MWQGVRDDRTGPDHCPGALRLHQAKDGALARVRLPAGVLSPAALRGLADLAAELGDGRLELTGRANVQLRGLPEDCTSVLTSRLRGLGLLPSAPHERVRNIMASPLSGLDRPGPDLTLLARELDQLLCAQAELAELPGRFLFALDDGRGDVAAAGPDIDLRLLPSGRLTMCGIEVAAEHALPLAITVASAFLRVRPREADQGTQVWRIAELPGGLAAVLAEAGIETEAGPAVKAEVSSVPVADPSRLVTAAAPPPDPVGLVARPDGRHAAVALVPLGVLPGATAQLLAELAGPGELRVTPWRSVVLTDVEPDVLDELERAGLGVSETSPWYRLSACAGHTGCAKAAADVRADAAAAAGSWPGRRVHYSGCSRRCGLPGDVEVELLATEDGYRISA